MVLRRNVGANLKIICVREQQQQHVDVWFVRTALRDPSTNRTGPQWTNSSKNGIKPNLTWFQFKGWNQLVFLSISCCRIISTEGVCRAAILDFDGLFWWEMLNFVTCIFFSSFWKVFVNFSKLKCWNVYLMVICSPRL